MNIYEYKEKVLCINKEALHLAENTNNSDHLSLLNNLITSLTTLVNFVNEDLSLKVLDNYSNKAAEDQDSCPLDVLCKNVLQKLTDIELLLEKEIFNFLRPENNQSGTRTFPRNTHNSHEFNALNNKLKDHGLNILLSAFDVLKHLEGHSKTLIVLGPNGSGKTSFANYIKTLEEHIKVIPASKPIMVSGYIPGMYNATIESYNAEIYRGGTLDKDLLQKLIVGLCTEHDNAARRYYDTGDRVEKTTYEKVKEIFDAFFEVKLDNSAFASKEMKAKKTEFLHFRLII